jgi:hypothetical protein
MYKDVYFTLTTWHQHNMSDTIIMHITQNNFSVAPEGNLGKNSGSSNGILVVLVIFKVQFPQNIEKFEKVWGQIEYSGFKNPLKKFRYSRNAKPCIFVVTSGPHADIKPTFRPEKLVFGLLSYNSPVVNWKPNKYFVQLSK